MSWSKGIDIVSKLLIKNAAKNPTAGGIHTIRNKRDFFNQAFEVIKQMDNKGFDIDKITERDVKVFLGNPKKSGVDSLMQRRTETFGDMNQITGNLEDQQWYQDAITRNRNQNTRETLRVIEGGGLDNAEFADFKDKYFTKLIANTDEDIQAFIKRVINRKQDDEFNKLSQDQMKEFLKIADDRIKMGHRKFIDKYKDVDWEESQMNFNMGGPVRYRYKMGKGVKGVTSVIDFINKKFGKGTINQGVDNFSFKNQDYLDNREMFKRLTRKLDQKQDYKNALALVQEIDKKPLRLDEIVQRYTTLSKFPEGKSVIRDDLYEIERGEMIPNIGNQTRSKLIEDIRSTISTSSQPAGWSNPYDHMIKKFGQFRKKQQPNPFDEFKETEKGQIEMDFEDWDPKGMASGGRIGFARGKGPSHSQLVTMYMEQGMSYEDAVQAANASTNLPWDILKAEGGRVPFLYGGGSGLKNMLQYLLKKKAISPKKASGFARKVSPRLSDKMKAWMQEYHPRDSENLESMRTDQYENVLGMLKADKGLLDLITKAKSLYPTLSDKELIGMMRSAGNVPEHIAKDNPFWEKLMKYTDIDQAIVDMEMILKNQATKGQGRKLNADGGIQRIGFKYGKGVDLARRTFLKLLAGVMALPIAAPLLKKAAPKVAPKVIPKTQFPGVEGMPDWFPTLVSKFKDKGKLVDLRDKDFVQGNIYELNVPIKGKENVKVKMEHNERTGEITIDWRGTDDTPRGISFSPGETGFQRYGSDPEFPTATENVKVEVERPEFNYTEPDYGSMGPEDTSPDSASYLDIFEEEDEVVEYLRKWATKDLGSEGSNPLREALKKHQKNFKTHNENMEQFPDSTGHVNDAGDFVEGEENIDIFNPDKYTPKKSGGLATMFKKK